MCRIEKEENHEHSGKKWYNRFLKDWGYLTRIIMSRRVENSEKNYVIKPRTGTRNLAPVAKN